MMKASNNRNQRPSFWGGSTGPSLAGCILFLALLSMVNLAVMQVSSAIESTQNQMQAQLMQVQRQNEEIKQLLLRGTASGNNNNSNNKLLTQSDNHRQELEALYRRFKHQTARKHSAQDAIDAQCGTAPDYSSFFALGEEMHSGTSQEDAKLYNNLFRHYLKSFDDEREHTYVELGAFNGMKESNSRFYDVCLGWKGLLVEANPHVKVWDELVQNRPTAHRMRFAASCPADQAHRATVPFYEVKWTNAGQAKGVSTAYHNDTTKTTVDVPCGSLTPFIQDLLGSHVTFMSLDVEGAEPLVLEQIDFSQVTIDLLLIENTNSFCKEKCATRDRFRDIMTKAGYIMPDGDGRQFVPRSDIWIHPQSPFLQMMEERVWIKKN